MQARSDKRNAKAEFPLYLATANGNQSGTSQGNILTDPTPNISPENKKSRKFYSGTEKRFENRLSSALNTIVATAAVSTLCTLIDKVWENVRNKDDDEWEVDDLLPVLPELLKNAVLIQSEVFKNKENVTSRTHLLASKVHYGANNRYVAVMVIHESNGDFYYDHSMLVLNENGLKQIRAEAEKRNPAESAGSSSPSAQVLNVASQALLSSGFDEKASNI